MSHHGGHGYTRTQAIRAERRLRAEEVAKETGYSDLSLEDKLKRVLGFISLPGNILGA